jgi:hypothetical protein
LLLLIGQPGVLRILPGALEADLLFGLLLSGEALKLLRAGKLGILLAEPGLSDVAVLPGRASPNAPACAACELIEFCCPASCRFSADICGASACWMNGFM